MDAGATVTTFATTTDSFAFEDTARAEALPGRLIPLPTGIAAGCGLAWLSPPLTPPGDFATDHQLPVQGVFRFGVNSSYHRLDRPA